MDERGSIEQAFQAAFDGHTVQVDAAVWGAVKAQIGGAAMATAAGTGLLGKVAAVIGAVALIGGATISELQYQRASHNTAVEKITRVTESANTGKAAQFEAPETTEGIDEVIVESTPTNEQEIQPTTKIMAAPEATNNGAEQKAPVSTILSETSGNNPLKSDNKGAATAQDGSNDALTGANPAKAEAETPAPAETPEVKPEPEVSEPVLSSATVDYEREVYLTPNGDWNNDELTISSTDIAQIDVVIFNRAGKEVFRSSTPEFRWDGKDKSGQLVPKGTYFSFITAQGNDGKPVSAAPMKTTIYVNY